MKIDRFNEVKKEYPDIVPKGWVNIKIDEQLFMRMEKYVKALDSISPKDKYDLFKKIETLSNVESIIDNRRIPLQKKLSIILILQYLKEIHSHFNASSAGFLIEGFLATLIHGKLSEPYSKSDIIASYDELDAVQFEVGQRNGKDYQIKFYKHDVDIKISWESERICDYYVICVKKLDGNIAINILDGKDTTSDSFVGKFAQYNRRSTIDKLAEINVAEDLKKIVKVKDGKKFIIIKNNKLSTVRQLTLDVVNIDSLIERCANKVKESLTETYDNLSKLHFNIESLVSGYRANNRDRITPDEAVIECEATLNDLKSSVMKLKEGFTKK